jgi:hypothetical protein
MMAFPSRVLRLLVVAQGGLLACGPSNGGSSSASAGSSSTSVAGTGGAIAAGGSSAQTGSAGQIASAGSGGTVDSSGSAGAGGVATVAGAPGTAGSAGVQGSAGTGGTTSSGGAAGTGGSGGIGEDIPPWRDLNITVPAGQHTHMTPIGLTAGMDNRSAKMAGKLEINLGGTAGGGYDVYLGKRGFHVIGVSEVYDCVVPNWPLGRDFPGNCRLNTLDGMPHGDQHNVTPEQSIMNQVLQTLTTFEKSYPGEGWGYFLTQDGKGVRWSDTVFTGESHGAQNAACFAHELRLFRVVAQSGPRENACGKGVATSDYDPNNLPFWPVAATCDATHCCLDHVAGWIDAPSATPIDRYYGFTGKEDPQFGDIMFSMDRMNFVGAPVNVNEVAAPYNGSHRFYGNVGHVGTNDFPNDAVNIAFGVLPENAAPKF